MQNRKALFNQAADKYESRLAASLYKQSQSIGASLLNYFGTVFIPHQLVSNQKIIAHVQASESFLPLFLLYYHDLAGYPPLFMSRSLVGSSNRSRVLLSGMATIYFIVQLHTINAHSRVSRP